MHAVLPVFASNRRQPVEETLRIVEFLDHGEPLVVSAIKGLLEILLVDVALVEVRSPTRGEGLKAAHVFIGNGLLDLEVGVVVSVVIKAGVNKR